MSIAIIGGLLFGYLVFDLNARLLLVTLERAKDKAPGQAVKYIVSRYYLRFAIEGTIICLAVWWAGRFFGIATLGGMLLAKAVFLLRVRKLNINYKD
ncbi:MAG: hypothetical protein HPY81_04420 [Firmicutes bacterium]|nr:hypothetical protein [Bacillota bacterium]